MALWLPAVSLVPSGEPILTPQPRLCRANIKNLASFQHIREQHEIDTLLSEASIRNRIHLVYRYRDQLEANRDCTSSDSKIHKRPHSQNHFPQQPLKENE